MKNFEFWKISCIFEPNKNSIMEERYYLPNRDGDKIWLQHFEDCDYLLVTEHDYPIQITYDRKNKEKIVAVDPSGGPFIYRGYEVIEDGITIQDIRWEKGVGFIITLTE